MHGVQRGQALRPPLIDVVRDQYCSETCADGVVLEDPADRLDSAVFGLGPPVTRAHPCGGPGESHES